MFRRWAYFIGVWLLPLGVLSDLVIAQVHHPNPRLPEDIPEEILETEIILEGRSPIDGERLTPADYAQLQEELRLSRGEVPGRLSPKLHRAVILLRLRKLLGTLFPFLF